jgi:hypothetical protein
MKTGWKWSYLPIIVLFSIGAFVGAPLNSCIHEAGHFISAYIFDKSQINQTQCFIPEQYYTLNLAASTVGRVTLIKPAFEAYPFYQALIILLSGQMVDLLFFISLLVLLNHLITRKSKSLYRYSLKVAFPLGLMLGSMQVTIGWWGDVNQILLQYTTDMFILNVVMRSMLALATLSFLYIASVMTLRFAFVLRPKARKIFLKKKNMKFLFGRWL